MRINQFINKTIIMSLLVALLLFCSCGSDNPIIPPDPVIVIPSNLTFSVEIVGANSNEPYGDGSGTIKIDVSATNAVSYGFRPGTGGEENNATGTFEYTYKESGTNTFTIDVLAYSSTGNSIKSSKDITIMVTATSNLVWSDEFDSGTTPDTTKWTYDLGDGCPNVCGWGNNESQYYTSRIDNVSIENGILKIKAKKENYQGYEYTSARLKTQGKFSFKYGKIEIRAKLPEGGGTWPAIWMLGSNITTVGWPACGEIDIMEHIGNDLGTIHESIHTPSSYGATVNTKTINVADASTAFHIYAVNWTSDKIEFLIDDKVYYTYNPSTKNSDTWPFNANQFIILNVAMGGNFGGNIDPNFVQGTMEIDYVRVYQ